MLSSVLRALLVLGVFVAGISPAPAQVHKDARIGFQIKVPKQWTQIPLQSDEQWVVAKFNCDKPDFYTSKSTGYTSKHSSTLRVVAFVDQFIERGQVIDLEDEEESDEEIGESIVLLLTTIYRNYEEFLKENFDGGVGYFIAEDTQTKVAGLEVRCLQIEAEGVFQMGPRILTTWIYTTEIGKVAIEFEVLESEYRAKRSMIEKTLKSFRPIPRTEPLTLARSSDFVSFFALDGLTPEARNQRKRAMHQERWDKLQAGATEGWSVLEIDDFGVLTRHDKKHAQAVVASIGGVMDWLDKAFPFIGSEEYVRRPFVRICKDREEQAVFREGGGLNQFLMEIVTHKDQGGSTGYEWSVINQRGMEVWFNERDPGLLTGLPAWFGSGLRTVLGGAKVKGSKLKFQRNSWERGFRDDQEPWSLEEVMRMRSEELLETQHRAMVQTAALTRFLVDGSGSKGKYKGFLTDYIKHTTDVLAEIEEELRVEREAHAEDEEDDSPQTEEEEDARIKERKQGYALREQRILDQAFERTAAGRTESVMASLSKAYLKELK